MNSSTGGDSMMIIIFVTCVVILLLIWLGLIGVIVLYYQIDHQCRIMTAKYVAAASSIINQGNQQFHV